MATSLYSKDIRSAGDVDTLFGSDKGLLVCRPGRPLRPYFSIPDGCYALVTKFGKDFDYADGQPVWPPGFHFGNPWVKVANMVTKQSVVFDMPVKACKTQDNVTVQIDLAIVFRIMGDTALGEDPALIRNFVYKVTARGLQQQLTDACEGATRTVARTLMHTEVYGLRTDKSGKTSKVLKGQGEGSAATEVEGDEELRTAPDDAETAQVAITKGRDVADDMRRTLNEQFHPQGVQITDVIITDVKLPDVIVSQMAEKTTVIAQNAAQKMNQEYEMLTLKQNEEGETLRQKKKEEREKEKQNGDQEVNEVQVQLEKMKAETKVLVAKLSQESNSRVQTIIADGTLEVTKLQQEKAAMLTEMRAKAMSEAETLKAGTGVYEETALSKARLEAAKNMAKASETIAKAEGVIAPYVDARKQYEMRHHQMQVWESLANNKDLVLSGEDNSELNAVMLCDAIMDSASDETTKSQMLSELLVLQRGSKVMLNLAQASGNE